MRSSSAKKVGSRSGFAARLSRPADRVGEAAWLLLWARSNERLDVAAEERPQNRVPEVLGDVRRLYGLIRLLRTEVPAFADLLTVKNLTRAAGDARYRDRLQRNFAAVADNNSEALKAVFERQPEALELLEWPGRGKRRVEIGQQSAPATAVTAPGHGTRNRGPYAVA